MFFERHFLLQALIVDKDSDDSQLCLMGSQLLGSQTCVEILSQYSERGSKKV